MAQVDHEQEMKFLLLEKDFEFRDALDLIPRFSIVELLESRFAENVVKEIWHSSYATHDSIVSASTNHMLVFEWWDCVRDVEQDQPFFRIKDVSSIEAHLMQFTVWRFSPKARTIIEFLVTVMFATLVHIYVATIIDTFEARLDDVNILLDREANLATFAEKTS